MTSIDTRSREIILQILQSDEPIQVEKLARKLDISPNALTYNLRTVKNWLNFKNLKFDRNQENCISIQISKYQKQALISELRKLDNKSLILSPVERQRYILLSLLTLSEHEPILSKQLALILGVSRPTILNDLDETEKWLKRFNLILDRRPGWGFSIIGKESDYRSAIENILLDTMGEISLLALYQGEHNSLFSKVNEGAMLLTPLPLTRNSLNLDFCGNLVEQVEQSSHFFFSDSSHVSLALFFAILISRLNEDKFIEPFPEGVSSRINEKTKQIAEKIAKIIEKKIQIEIPQAEIINIAIRISSIRSRQTISSEDSQINELVTFENIENIVLEMIQEASRNLHPILNIDQKLKKGLLVHIKPAINRLIFNLPIKNLLLPEIKKKYPYIYKVSEKSSRILSEKIGCEIPEEEIGFIAMHFAAAMERLGTASDKRINAIVVCGGGCATAWILVSRIQAEFPGVEIKKVCSLLEMSEEIIKDTDIDLVISTIPLENLDMPNIVVSPLFNEEDHDEIEEVINRIEKRKEEKQFYSEDNGFSITSLLSPQTIQTNIHVDNWQSAVEKACKPLLEQRFIEQKYIDGIFNLLNEHGPYMVLSKGVVLLHAMIGYGVNNLCMSLTTFSPTVKFGHKSNDPVSVSIVFGTTDSRSHLRALSELSRLLGRRQFIEELNCSKNADEVMSIINSFISQYL